MDIDDDLDFDWSTDPNQPVEMPIDGVLDLHAFSPKEIKQLVPDYIEACLERGITEVRIIHGKGKGTLRRIVHCVLENHPAVARYRLDSQGRSSWGATLVDLLPEEARPKDT